MTSLATAHFVTITGVFSLSVNHQLPPTNDLSNHLMILKTNYNISRGNLCCETKIVVVNDILCASYRYNKLVGNYIHHLMFIYIGFGGFLGFTAELSRRRSRTLPLHVIWAISGSPSRGYLPLCPLAIE